MSINLAKIYSLLRPGLAAVQGGEYRMYEPQWKDSYSTYKSDKAVEVSSEMRFMSVAQLKAEGASLAYDNNMGDRSQTQFFNRSLAIGYVMTREALRDNLYKEQFPKSNKSLSNSMDQAKEILAAALYNNGFDGNFPIYDGVSLFNVAHPIDNGTVSNALMIPADLTESSLESGLIGIRQFKDAAGLKIKCLPMRVHVNSNNEWNAGRLEFSKFRLGTANNDISITNYKGAIPNGYYVNQFFNQYGGTANIWFIQTDVEGLKHFEREEIEYDMYADFDTKSIKVSAYERYCFGCDNFRAVFGSHG